MTTAVVPRWEWRTFGDRFPDALAVIAALPHLVKDSAETYLLCPAPDVNAKIRGHQLDIKRLQQRARGLELWSPVFKADFPITAADVARLFHEWALPAPALTRATYTLDQLLSEVIARTPAITVAPIVKTRRQAQLDGCAIEVSTVRLAQRALETVAVESEQPEQVEPVVRRLGLAGVANENYVAGLTRVWAQQAHQRRAQEGAHHDLDS